MAAAFEDSIDIEKCLAPKQLAPVDTGFLIEDSIDIEKCLAHKKSDYDNADTI